MVRRCLGTAVLLLAAVVWSLPATGRGAPTASPWRQLQSEYLQDLRARMTALPADGDEQLAYALAVSPAPALQSLRRDVFARLAAEVARPDETGHPDAARVRVHTALWIAVASRRTGSRDALDLGAKAFAAAMDLIEASRADGLSALASEWVEAEPSAGAVRALTAVLPKVAAGRGETRAIVLTHLGNALAHLGKKQEASARFREAVAEPKLDWWPEGHMAARDAFAAWARVEPDAALAKAKAQMGGYHDVWSGPELLTSFVTAAAAETIAKTDLPRAMQMVRTAPRTQWALGGVADTRGRAMLTLAQAIAGKHSREAEQLIGEAFRTLRPYPVEVFKAADALPAPRRRAWLAKLYPGYARSADLVGSGLLDVRMSGELKLLMRANPTLLPRLVQAWGEQLPKGDAARHDRETNNPALTGLVSAVVGRDYLQADVHDPNLAAAQVVQWIDLAHAVEVSLAKR